MSPDWSTSSGCREHSQASSGLVLPLSVCSKYLEQLPLSTWNKHLGFFSVLQIGLEANLFSGIAPPHQLYLPANPTLCLLCPPFQLNTFQIWFLVCVFSVSLCSASFGWLILEIVFFFFYVLCDISYYMCQGNFFPDSLQRAIHIHSSATSTSLRAQESWIHSGET